MSSVGSGGLTSWSASLFQAAAKGDELRVRQLIQEANFPGENYKGALRIALQKVAGRGHESLTRFLLQEGAEINTVLGGEAPALFKAAELGKDKIVKALLDYGADLRGRDRTQRTAIFPAAQKNHSAALKILLDAGIDVNTKDANNQNVLLFLASERPERPIKWGEEVIRLLLNTNLELEAKDKDGRTALLWAAATGREFLAALLLSGRTTNGADIQASNNRGKTALHLATENHRVSLVKFLLESGADPQAQSDGGWTALHNAADKGYKDVVMLLLQGGADVNATTSSGMTALHWCSRNGHLEVVELLLQHKDIRRNCKDSFDSTPMLGAAQNGHLDIVERLSPADDGDLLTASAKGACEGFQATVVDFGMEHRPMNHTKHSVFDVLYGWDEKTSKPLVTTLTKNVPAKPKFRWIHLPSNNMTWVETLLTKHFVENRAHDVEGFKVLEKSFVQLHRGPTVHSHFMRPMCQRMPPTVTTDRQAGGSESSQEKTDTENPPQTPTLRVEITPPKNDDISATDVSGDRTPKKSYKKGERFQKANTSPQNGNATKRPRKDVRSESSPYGRRSSYQQSRSKIPGTRTPKKTEPCGNMVLFMPYLHYETHLNRKEMSSVIKQATAKSNQPSLALTKDEMLIHAYLQSTHNLQIRRTLDQFYYHAISTDDRDEDQVVYRYTKTRGKEVKVFMVDQLWLWVLGDDLLVTSFPQRWDQPKNDPLNVLDGIIEDMGSKTRPIVRSIYDLATLVTGRCCGVFDRHRVGDEEYQFLDMFESSIGEVTDKETELFKKFNDASSLAALWLKSHSRSDPSIIEPGTDGNDLNSGNPRFVDTLLDIGEETALLAETKDIRDELNMISLVLQQQLSILDSMTIALLAETKGRQDRQAEIKRRFRELSKVVEMHIKDVERMDRQAEGIYGSIAHLLDLKQKHANAFEARFARDQAAFTGRQGQTIMVFTIVTVVFLPMSFIAALFTIPIRDFPHQTLDGSPSLPLSYVSKFVFGVGLAISIPLIAIAFAVDDLSIGIRRSFRRLTTLGKRRTKTKAAASSPPPPIRATHRNGAPILESSIGTKWTDPRTRRSEEAYKRRQSASRSYVSEDRTYLSSPSPSHRRRSLMGDERLDNRAWKHEPEWNGGVRRGSRDLERGIQLS